MGVTAHISDSISGRFGKRGLAGVLVGLVALALMGAAASFAGSDKILSDQPVSTSPTHGARRDSGEVQPPKALPSNDPPLTRAAMQLRIDEMSPTHWLSRFGDVSIAHRE